MNTPLRFPAVRAAALLLAVLALAATYMFGAFSGAAPRAGASAIPSVPPAIEPNYPPASPDVLSPTLSYYFISGNAFVPYGQSTNFFHQVIGCMNQVDAAVPFTAAVHLPNGSQVSYITLYTWDVSSQTPPTSTAYFILSDSKGFAGAGISVTGSGAGYQSINSAVTPWTIDNQTYNYVVEWRLNQASTTHSLCGIRVAYYAPGNGVFVPIVTK